MQKLVARALWVMSTQEIRKGVTLEAFPLRIPGGGGLQPVSLAEHTKVWLSCAECAQGKWTEAASLRPKAPSLSLMCGTCTCRHTLA